MPVDCFIESWMRSKPSPWKPSDSKVKPVPLSRKMRSTVFSP